MGYTREIEEIGKIIQSYTLIHQIREEVASVMKEGATVMDGLHHPLGKGYDVVVKCSSDKGNEICRRIRGSVPDIEVKGIVGGVLGIRVARRKR